MTFYIEVLGYGFALLLFTFDPMRYESIRIAVEWRRCGTVVWQFRRAKSLVYRKRNRC